MRIDLTVPHWRIAWLDPTEVPPGHRLSLGVSRETSDAHLRAMRVQTRMRPLYRIKVTPKPRAVAP